MSNKDEGASVQNSLAGSETNAHTHYKAETPSEPKKTVEPSIPVMMSSSCFSTKPKGGVLFQRIGIECVRNGFRYFTPQSFCEHIANGHAFIPACLKNERKNENFMGQQIFCLDFDDLADLEAGEYKDEGANIALMNYAVSCGFKVVCIYPTYNYTKENPRCRLVIDNEAIIKDVKERNEAMDALFNMFRKFKPDESCSDPARLFFGTREEVYSLCQ